MLAHGFKTAREYKEKYGLDVKKGLTVGAYQKLLRKQVFENGTIKNLQGGIPYRFTVKDVRAGKYVRSRQTLSRLKNLHLHKLEKPSGFEMLGRFTLQILKRFKKL